jgi:glycosyltransferase involved in cell wall biosynthesis
MRGHQPGGATVEASAGGGLGADEAALRIVSAINFFRPAYTGAGVQAEHLFRELGRLGVDVTVLCPLAREAPAPRRERQGAIAIRRFRIPRFDETHKVCFGAAAALWLLRRSDWDLLHLHSFGYWAVPIVLAAWLRRRPVLVKTTILPGTPRRALGLPQRIPSWVFMHVDAIVAISRELESIYSRRKSRRTRLLAIPNGVDGETFHPGDATARERARAGLGLPVDALVVVTVGMLNSRKNIVGLVEAVGRLRHRPVCLVLAGPPSEVVAEREDLRRAIAQLPPGVEARMPGSLPPAEVAELLRASDVFVLASRAEGMPNSLLEAMASGLACVATDIPGSRDVLARGGGVLVPVDDAKALAREIDRLAADPAERRRLGEEAQRIVESDYSIRSVACRYREAYRDLIGRGRA